MNIIDMIYKWDIELAKKDGQVALKVRGRATEKQVAMLKAAKPQIIAELQRLEAEKAAREAREKAEQEAVRQAILAGEKNIQLMYHDGEYLSGWEVVGQSVELMKELGLAKYVSGWGYYVDYKAIKALGKEFTYQQAREYAQPMLDAKSEKLRKKAEAQATREAERASMTIKILKQGRTMGEEPDPYADVEITDPATGESARFVCRNIFDCGYVVNPAYAVAEGLEPGGIVNNGHWQTFDEKKGWYNVRPLTEFETRAIAYLHKFPPIYSGTRM